MSQPTENQAPQPGRWIYLLPLSVLSVLMVVLYLGLGLNSRLLPSPLIGQPVPQFFLPKMGELDEAIRGTDLKGEVSLLNIWATWCTSCKQEHPVLMKIAESKEVPVYGLFYKDDPVKGVAWLQNYGDPYRANAVDVDGKVGIEWGAYGTPETFLIDQEGIVRYKHVGPLSWHDWQSTILPMIKSLRGGNGV